MRPSAAAGFIVALAVLVAGSLGTEDLPEMTDPSGDVAYDPLYPSTQPREDFIDIEKGWFEYNNSTDAVAFHLRVVDSTKATTPTRDNSWSCDLSAATTISHQATGNLTFAWAKALGDDKVVSSVSWKKTDTSGGPVRFGAKSANVKHSFAVVPGKPGYYLWNVDRPAVLQFGDAVERLGGTCRELVWVAGTPVPLYLNQDNAISSTAFDIAGLRPPSSGEVSPTPDEPTTSQETNQSNGGTPALSIVGVLAGLACAFVLARRKP